MAVSTTVLWMSCSEGENTASHLCFFTETISFTSKQGSNRNEYRASPHFDCVTRLLSTPPRQSTVDCLVHTINCRWRIFSEHLNNTKSYCNFCTFRASRSLSRLCPMRMVSALNMLSSTAWTSRRLMVTFSKSSSVTPENLRGKCNAFLNSSFRIKS